MTSIIPFFLNLRAFFSRRVGFGLFTACLIFLTGCQASGTMRVQPYNRPLSANNFFADGSSARSLVVGTVPQTDQRVDDPVLTGKNEDGDILNTLPVPVTNELIQRGQERFNIYCVVCHGVDGHANGKAIAFGFPKPPDLLESNPEIMTDGKIFDVIANGQGNMLSYGYRVKAADRWAIVAYIRAMQLNNGHLTQDLTSEQLQQLGNK